MAIIARARSLAAQTKPNRNITTLHYQRPLSALARTLLGIGDTKRKLILISLDCILLLLAVAAAYWLRTNTWYLPDPGILWTYPLAVLTGIPAFLLFALYRYSIRHMGANALLNLLQAVSLAALLWSLAIALLRIDFVPRSVFIIYWLLALLLIIGSRYLGYWLARAPDADAISVERKITLIYGAGSAGRLAKQALAASEYKVVAFVDDDAKQQGKIIDGYRVYPPSELDKLASKLRVSSVLLALPSVSPARRREIIGELDKLQVEIRSLPSLSDLASGKISASSIKRVDITDLLGREPVPADTELLAAKVRARVVLVSGAGGSIGSELARQIVALQPQKLILVDFNEYGLYSIHAELATNSANVQPYLGDLTDAAWVEQLVQAERPQTIFHAAAYKHVPMLEDNPISGFRNNLLSTYHLAASCAGSGADCFTLVSTDKAVAPESVMGLSKRYAELTVLSLQQQHPELACNVVRFGNVLDSSGSVIPLFRGQIAAGGPVTVTDKRMTRYFMTISEAASLVIQAGAMDTKGAVFVLDMGEPVNIYEMATKMITLSGLSVRDSVNKHGDIAIAEIGARKGEKMHEVLSTGSEFKATSHSKILRIDEHHRLFADPQQTMDNLIAQLDRGELPPANA